MENKRIIWKRIVAYAIDVLLITLVVSMISSVKFLNPKLDSYNKEYKNYVTLTEKYQDKKIKQEEYKKQYNNIYYKLQKNSVYYNFIYLVMIILYFGVFQYMTKGQTIGKKLMKLQVVSKDEKEDVPLGRYMLRSLLLYSTLYYFFLTVGVFFLTKGYYSAYSTGLYYANMVLELIIIYLVFTRSDMRGLHDLLANTKVISLEEENIETKEEKTIIDAEIIEEKPKKKKSATKKEEIKAKKTSKTSSKKSTKTSKKDV